LAGFIAFPPKAFPSGKDVRDRAKGGKRKGSRPIPLNFPHGTRGMVNILSIILT
jgi:hypothetical protein